MQKTFIAMFFVAAAFLMMVGCSQDRSPVSWETDNQSLASAISIPQEATLESATLSLFGFDTHAQTVNIHRVTADWDEMTVTYNSFAGAFDPAIIGSFMADGPAWYDIDVTATVNGWINGDFENFGFYLEQGETDYTRYFSSEYSDITLRPKLTLTYSMNGSSVTKTIQRGTDGEVADAYISAFYPNTNNGSLETLFTGVISDQLKMALLKFDIELGNGNGDGNDCDDDDCEDDNDCNGDDCEDDCNGDDCEDDNDNDCNDDDCEDDNDDDCNDDNDDDDDDDDKKKKKHKKNKKDKKKKHHKKRGGERD